MLRHVFKICFKGKHKKTKLKMLQARFDWAFDGNGKCKLPPTPPSTGLSIILHLKWTGTIFNFETSAGVFIWRLSWNLQCDTQVPFHEKRLTVPSKEMRVSLTKKQWAGLNKMEFWCQRLWSLHIRDKKSKDKFKNQATYPQQ
jgi:hypothetical protein